MKIQMKTIKSDYNTDTGLSSVTIVTDIGQITGYSKLNPEDAEIASTYAGCRYAEMRASIKYMKAKAKIAEYKLQPLLKIYNEIKGKISYDKNNYGVKCLEREIYLLEDEKQTFLNNVKSLSEKLNKDIQERPDIIKKLQEKDNK